MQGETTEMTVIPAFASNSVANEEEDTNDDDTYDEGFEYDSIFESGDDEERIINFDLEG